MPLVRRIQGRNANIVVEAHGEVLFAGSGPVGRWTNRFSHRVRAASAGYAPTNKRPRWAHYGKPLKSTFTASTTYQPGRMRVYAAIGSSAPHAYYVDQGTKGFNAKILPPTSHGGSDLREATWRVPNPATGGTRQTWSEIGTIPVSGQRAQEFFARGLARGFQSMRMRSYQIPADPRISGVLDSIPTGMTGFKGNTPADGAFVAQLQEWRADREAAWRATRPAKPRRARTPRRATAEQRRRWWREAQQRARDRARDKKKSTDKDKSGYTTVAAKKAAALAAFKQRYPGVKIISQNPAKGVTVRNQKGQQTVIPWSDLYKFL